LLDEAAGVLMSFKVGNQAAHFFQEMMTGKSIKIAEKLRIMLFGEHKGIYLFKGWKIGKSKMRKLELKYAIDFLRYRYMF
jgi:hypothetical protein